jgi:hypothetical protein
MNYTIHKLAASRRETVIEDRALKEAAVVEERSLIRLCGNKL